MNSLKSFIQNEVLLKRLQSTDVLVVYDPDQRYRDLCLELASPERRVVDATQSSIESRELAIATLQTMGQPNAEVTSLLVYVPAKAPLTDEDKQRDPFSIYTVCGAVFPAGSGDEYLSLCLKSKPDYVTEIRRLFSETPNPSFAMIDAIGGGSGWPTLQALLKVESARDILFALLVPSELQLASLKSHETWLAEAKALFQASVGLKLLTRGKSWSSVADELWRFLLFSEFVFDLPAELPGSLTEVPRAVPEARPLVEDLCERLRSDRRTQSLYIERAEAIEKELDLTERCQAITDLGVRDTFPFEERSFFAQGVLALQQDNFDRLRQLFGRHTHSVWGGRGENQVQWTLLQSAVSLIEACGDADRQLPEHAKSQETLIDFYVGSLREVDRRQREFEQSASDSLGVHNVLDGVITQARAAYGRLVGSVQESFVRHLEKSGWPPSGRLANADVFDRIVAPKLQEAGRRVAVLLIDSLRYELGLELQKQLADDGQVELQAAFAQLPTVTPVGMASLLPGAGQELRLVKKNNEMVVMLNDQPLTSVTQRMDVLRKRYGQRFAEVPLTEFIRSKQSPPSSVDLLVLRSNTIDSHLESTPDMALRIILDALKEIRVAIHKLKSLGFQDAVIVTDHGFFLNSSAGAGDVCHKPPGTWLNIHDRCQLGDGAGDVANFAIAASQLGLRGDFNQVAGPRSMVAYRAGTRYFHGGASLQEAVVPVICLRLTKLEEDAAQSIAVSLTYKRGAKLVTTRFPVVEVTATGNLFSAGSTFEILVEANDKQGNVVGEAKPGGLVNPATRTVTVKPGGGPVQVTMKMDLDFEGKFTVKALDPTTLTAYSKLELATDYTV